MLNRSFVGKLEDTLSFNRPCSMSLFEVQDIMRYSLKLSNRTTVVVSSYGMWVEGVVYVCVCTNTIGIEVQTRKDPGTFYVVERRVSRKEDVSEKTTLKMRLFRQS